MIINDQDTQHHSPDGRTSGSPSKHHPAKFMDFHDASVLPLLTTLMHQEKLRR
jgi:hypothetical protein